MARQLPQHAQAFWLRTIRGQDLLTLPPQIGRINSMFVRVAGVDIRLLNVPPDYDMTQLPNGGRPSWYQVGSQVRLWPVPDDEYDLCVCTLPQDAEPPSAITPQSSSRDKALVLLRRWLTPAQRRCFDTHGYFIVVGGVTGTLYRINNAHVYNIEELDAASGFPVRKLCFVPDNAPYEGDAMLAQKIMLETDEKNALRVANKQPVRGTTPIDLMLASENANPVSD